MGIFALIKSNYDQLVVRSDSLLTKVSSLSADQRNTFETEIDSLDLAIMKLARLIQKNPSVHAECKAQIDLDSLQRKTIHINKLVYEIPPETPLTKVALNAFAYGAIGGAIISELGSGTFDSSSQTSQGAGSAGLVREDKTDLIALASRQFASSASVSVSGFETLFGVCDRKTQLMLNPLINQIAGAKAFQVCDVLKALKDLIVDFFKYLLENPKVAKKILEVIVEMLSSGKDQTAIVKAVVQMVEQQKGK